MKNLRGKLTYANVMSTMCFFLLLGGGAYAAGHLGKNTVGPKQLKKNSVTTAKIKKEAVTAAKIKKKSLTGAQIDSSTLGTVPSAGNATTAGTASVANSLAAPEAWHVVGTPGEPEFQHNCQPQVERPPRFFKDHEEVVHLEGVYLSCAVGDTAYQLPPGYRPATLQQFPIISGGGNIAVWPSSEPELPEVSGAVKCGSTTCVLDGITFRAES